MPQCHAVQGMHTAQTGLQDALGVDSVLTEGLDPPYLSGLTGPYGLLKCLLGRETRVRCHYEIRQRGKQLPHPLSGE